MVAQDGSTRGVKVKDTEAFGTEELDSVVKRNRVKVTAGSIVPGSQEGSFLGLSGFWELSAMEKQESQVQGCSPACCCKLSQFEATWLVSY